MPSTSRSATPWIAMLAVVLALAFLGSRGIWDPDEGRYTNVALNMLDTGDWLHPRRSEDVGHWTKPPLTYWAIAASVGVFGSHAWAARLPIALAYLLSMWMTGRIAHRLAPGTGPMAALAYATMLLPFGASQLITTDFPLSAAETLAMWAFIEARLGAGTRTRAWLALMWTGFALGFLTKGPPALLPLLVIVLFNRLLFDRLLPERRRRPLMRGLALQWGGLVVFGLLALPWYIAVIRDTPGLLTHFIGNEVVNRIASDEFGRHGEWYGWLAIYAPTLLLGTLPWTATIARWLHTLPGAMRDWHGGGAARRRADAGSLLLAIWIGVPLFVFCLAQSRMPLYLLPLFVPMAMVVAMQRQREGRGLPDWRLVVSWAVLLLLLKVASAYWPTHKNARSWADAIRERANGVLVDGRPLEVRPLEVEPLEVRPFEIVFVEDMARYGLHLHLGRGTGIERIALDAHPQPRFDPSYDETLAQELAENEPHAIWICKQALWPLVQARIAALGYRAQPLGAPYEGRILFRITPAT